ncbi:MAG: hypothetical protein RL148_1956 [Planctomycetota bacterium]
MSTESFQLVVRNDAGQVSHTFHKDVVTIGRGQDCDLFLADRLVSRHHCRVEQQDGVFSLVDAGAQNPARLQGRPVARAVLRPGDVFTVGSSEVQLQLVPKVGSVLAGDTSLGEGEEASNLRELLRVVHALAEEQDLSKLLTLIVDAAIRVTEAERGFLVLAEGAESSIEVARNFAQEEIASPEFKLSRTIASRVRESGKAELTTNAQADDRFRDLQSVADLRLRSVLCIPLRVHGKVEGVLYVDNRLQVQAFGPQDQELLHALAEQAGVAIHKARTLETLRAQQVELRSALALVDQLNSALRGQLQARTAELDEVRAVAAPAVTGPRWKHDYSTIVGAGRAMRQLFTLLDKYIDADDPVLVTGESGTGKELVARAVHAQGKRRTKPFISENCAALPAELLESELFGHVKGAFTGAHANKQGLLVAADGGVLFLDEIGDMPVDLQKKLLRVLQEGEVRPVGSSEVRKVDVRLICATNRDLEEMVREGEFRQDLYYRISVLPVRLPPLRERREDIPLLVRRFLLDLGRETAGSVRISSDAMEMLTRHAWPGNVRELNNEIRRAAIVGDGMILPEHLSQQVRSSESPAAAALDDGDALPAERGTTLPDIVRELETRIIQRAQARAGANKSRAAELLGLSRFALQRKLEKYGLEPSSGGGAPEGEDA